MSSRLSTSQPVTIETELIPLVDNFWLEANGQTEQWYYDNTGEYAPDRSIIPLIITPNIKATDTDSHTSYTPNFLTERLEWYVQQWNGTAWVRTKVTNTTDTPANPFVIVGNTLKVNKNVESPQYGITIDCEATYIDPRDAGVTYPVRDSLTLTMNKDATVPYPKIQVLAESAQSFNPLKDSSSYDFKAKADWKGVSGDNGSLMYKADALGTEEIVSRAGTLPTTTPIIGNLRYGKGNGSTLKENQSFMFRQTSGGTVNPVPDSIAGIEKMKGNTVVWNQMSSINSFTNTYTDTKSYFQLQIISYLNTTLKDSYGSQGFTSPLFYGKIITIYDNTNRIRFKHNGSARDIDIMWIENVIPTHKVLITFYAKSVNPSSVGGLALNNIGVYDLTLMFGSGNEPTNAQDFVNSLSQPYYAYDAGRLLNFNPTGLKTVGFNLWDEEWEVGDIMADNGRLQPSTDNWRTKNYTRIFPSTKYYFTTRGMTNQNMRARFYDENYNYVGYEPQEGGLVYSGAFFTSPSNAYYIKFSPYDTVTKEICINLSDASKNGTYEAHWENTCHIDITTLKGRATGSTTDVVMFHDGLCSAGSVYDEIDLKNGRAVKRIYKVNLGDCTWQYYNSGSAQTSFFMTNSVDWVIKAVSSYSNNGNVICVKYVTSNGANLSNSDKITFLNSGGTNAQNVLRIKDTAYSDAATFKSAMRGVYAYFEMKTPIEYQFDPIPQGQWEWYGVSNGVEVKIDTLPSYVSGQGTDTLRVDALYDENMTVICRYRKFPWDTELIPQKEYRMVAWRVPNIDTIVVCKNGGSVNSASTGSYTFETIVNVKGEMISDKVKAANLRFNWKMRKSNTTTETDLGWGSTMDVDVSDLKSTVVNGNPVSTIVYCEVYLLGAYEPVTTNGVTTYERNIDLS